MKQPNILWIHTDEQRADSLGCYGSAWAKTPNFDSLAEQGTLFKNAFCQSPVCMPSRTSQLTATYPLENGGLNNNHAYFDFRQELKPFPLVFEEAGYHTASFGKHHTHRGRVWGTAKGILATNQHIDHFGLLGERKDADYGVMKSPSELPLVIGGTYPDGIENCAQQCVDEGIKFIGNNQQSGAPFLLRLSIEWPHTPVITPRPFDTLYDENTLPVRYYDQNAIKNSSRYDLKKAAFEKMDQLTDAQLRSHWRYYMGLVAYVDHEVGRMLAFLDENQLRENTIIVFSSDHGRMLGQKGFLDKGNFDTPAFQVPYIWSWPGYIPEGKREAGLAEMLDMPRTLLKLCGLKDKIPDTYRGRDLFADAPPEMIFAQIKATDEPAQRNIFRYAARMADWRMDIDFPIDGRELTEDEMDGNLYDLQADPLEYNNLFRDLAYIHIRNQLLQAIRTDYNHLHIDPRLKDPAYMNYSKSWSEMTGMQPRR